MQIISHKRHNIDKTNENYAMFYCIICYTQKKKKSLKIKYIFVKIWWLNANGRLAKHDKKIKIKAYNK